MSLSKGIRTLRTLGARAIQRPSPVLASASRKLSPSLLGPLRRRHLHGMVIGENATGSVGRTPLDFSKARIGQTIETPYELTVDDGWSAIWQSIFFQHDRIFTSDTFAQKIKLDKKVLPFYMMLFQTVSMSHVDEFLEILELGFENGIYIRPAYAGDTFRKQYYVKHIRPSSTGKGCVVVLQCELMNQDNEKVFSVDKVMRYPYTVSQYQTTSFEFKSPTLKCLPALNEDKYLSSRVLIRHIVENHSSLGSSCSLAKLLKGQLILHTFNRVLGMQNSFNLNTLFKQGHPLLLNTQRYDSTEIVAPGAVSLALAASAASRALFECLYEELITCQFVEKMSPESPLGAISYVVDIQDFNGLEEITMVTLGVKDVDVKAELEHVDIPIELFSTGKKVQEIRNIIKEKIPVLDDKVVVVMARRLVRQAPFVSVQNIPLL